MSGTATVTRAHEPVGPRYLASPSVTSVSPASRRTSKYGYRAQTRNFRPFGVSAAASAAESSSFFGRLVRRECHCRLQPVELSHSVLPLVLDDHHPPERVERHGRHEHALRGGVRAGAPLAPRRGECRCGSTRASRRRTASTVPSATRAAELRTPAPAPRGHPGEDDSDEERDPHPDVHDEEGVAVEPPVRERVEETDPVGVQKVEQRVRQHGARKRGSSSGPQRAGAASGRRRRRTRRSHASIAPARTTGRTAIARMPCVQPRRNASAVGPSENAYVDASTSGRFAPTRRVAVGERACGA